ncbi:MAG: Gldg family protein [Verrucomicrobiota bacterium]|jgi:ABC-type uncharacterized transport system involved in gliding motility auxiliary subunit|nr:Gldg family protein [Verrucomicrobiota bacterium]
MSKKQSGLFLYSSLGVAIMLVMLVVVNIISGHLKHRFDLTSENLYTLSEGTKQILGDLDTDVEIRFYATRDDKLMPVNFKNYISHVEDLLDEYSQYSNGHLKVIKFNPEPDSDAADSAAMDGVTGQMVSFGESIYLGLAISMLDQTKALPFLDPSREKLLEYDLTRAITQVTVDDKPTVGVMSALPVFGEQPNPMMMQMGRPPQQQPPWFLISQLQQDFDVRQLQMSDGVIPSDLDLLVVIHPKDITDQAQYAIDQYLMKGGKLIAFLDALAIVDQTPSPNGNNMLGPPPSNSNLETLLKAWGLEFDTSKIAADRQFAREVSFQRGAPPQEQPGILFMDPNGINGDDVVTSQIDQLLIPFSGAFKGTPVEGIEQTVLLNTSEEAQMVDAFMARLSGQQILKELKPEGKKYPLAMRLTGTFQSAYPEGEPTVAESTEDDLDSEDPEEEKPESLKSSKEGATVVLFGDADFLYDNFGVSQQNFMGSRMVQLLNGNLPLAQGVVEQMAGDSRLISVRGRATMNRPFTKIRDMEIVAAKAYQERINQLEEKKREAEQKINDIQRTRQDAGQTQGQRFVLTPEQQTELVKLRENNKQVTKDLKEMRRNLRKDIDALQNRLKWINIAGMPFLVTLGGIIIAMVKRKKTAAR